MGERAVCVRWFDSATKQGWRDKDISGPVEIDSVGWLVHKADKVIVLSTSRSASDHFVDQISIPTKCVRKMTKLKIPK